MCVLTKLTGIDCPGDGKCSSQGRCDDTIGMCICDAGFTGHVCEGNYEFIMFFIYNSSKSKL